jgi:hypothetical protein
MEAMLELTRRITLAESERSLHRSASHHIEAAACEIRIQALREARAIIKGRPLGPNEMHQSGWRRSAETQTASHSRQGEKP